MNSFYTVLIIIGSITLSVRIKELKNALNSGKKDKIKLEWLFLSLTIGLILVLIFIKNYRIN